MYVSSEPTGRAAAFLMCPTTLPLKSSGYAKINGSQKVRTVHLSMGTHLRATERDLPCGITQCFLPPNAGKLSPASRYWICLPRKDGRLS